MNTADEPFVSIVTPVYNGEKFLEECIESVLAQSYLNWAYIIVNNCSTDRSLEIARRLTEHDKRIHIHDNRDFLTSLQNFNHSLSPGSCVVMQAKQLHMHSHRGRGNEIKILYILVLYFLPQKHLNNSVRDRGQKTAPTVLCGARCGSGLLTTIEMR
mgnify:CR=1 FL=1